MSVGLSKRTVDLEQKFMTDSRHDLRQTVQDLSLKLTALNEALKAESARRKLAEKALQESDEKHRQLQVEYNEIVLNLQRQMEQVQKIEKVSTILAPVLAHDLKSLLGAISSLAQLSIEKNNLPSPSDEHLQLIYENSQRGNELIVRFLDFVKTLKFNGLSYDSIDLHDLIGRMWKIVATTIGRHWISFVSCYDKNLPRFTGDREKMERVFLNLLQNAAQSISNKGIITVKTGFVPSENVIEVNIIDNGAGILKKHRHKLFKPFFTTKKGGTGLGLSICHAIIEQHQGSIAIESQRKQGTKLSIRLPVAIM
jgi:signal transduction histidine kinase